MSTAIPGARPSRRAWRASTRIFVAVVVAFAVGGGAGAAIGIYRWHDRYHHGCGRGTDDDEIVWVSGADISAGGLRQDLIKAWNDYADAHNKMHAKLVAIPGGTDQQRAEMLAAQQSGSCSYDVLGLDVVWLPEFIRGGYLVQFPPGEFDQNAFLAKPWQAGTGANGRQYAIPFQSDVGLLYYRKDIDPRPPRTWDELSRRTTKAALQKLRGRDPAGLVTQLADYEGLTVNGMEAIWAAGGHVEKAERDGTTKIVVDRKAADALNRLTTGVGSSLILKDSAEFQEEDSVAAFRADRALFMRNWPYAYGVLAADPYLRNRFGVTELPGPGALGGQGLAIPTNALHKKEAGEFIRFLTELPRQQRLFCSGSVPVIRQAYEQANISACSQLAGRDQRNSPDVADPLTQQQLAQFAGVLEDALNHAKLRPDVPDYSGFSHAFHRYIHDAISQHIVISPNVLSGRLTSCAGEVPPNPEVGCP